MNWYKSIQQIQTHTTLTSMMFIQLRVTVNRMKRCDHVLVDMECIEKYQT